MPFFQNASSHFVTAVLTKLKFEMFLEGEHIMHAGDKGYKMYFIRTGVVDVINEETGKVTTSLSEGSHFGEICLLTDDRRVATIVCKTTCDLFSLSKNHFQELLIEYPEMRCALETVALNRLSKLGSKNVTSPISEMKQKGRISTTIPPPHISREVSPDDEEEDFEYGAKDDLDDGFAPSPPAPVIRSPHTLPPLRAPPSRAEGQPNTGNTSEAEEESEFHVNHDCD